MSYAKRLSQVAAAVVYCLLAAGIVFGYAALKPVLISEGVYRDVCTAQELQRDMEVCEKQELRLNFMFTLAAVSTNVAALPIGSVLDRFGPRVTSLIGCIFLCLGSLFLAFAGNLSTRNFDGYIPGYLFLALGGPSVFIPSFQLSNAFPARSGLVLALLTGAFDTSSALFLIYRLLYQGTDGAFKPQQFFLIYLIVPAAIAVSQMTLMPKTSYHNDEQPTSTSPALSPLADTETDPLVPKNENKRMPVADVTGALHDLSAPRQIRSPYFILMTLFTIIQMTRVNFFVATIRPQYSHLIDPHFAKQLNGFFDIALPLGGVFAAPLVGALLDHLRVAYVLSLLVGTGAVIGMLGLIPEAWAGYVNVVLFVLYRPFFYTAVSDYAAKVFGFKTFGQTYGLIICLAGLGNFSQSGLDKLTYAEFGGDYRPANTILLVAALIVGVALVGFVYKEGKQMQRRRLLEEDAARGRSAEGDGSATAYGS
ncbi:MAG: hypothetical protein Q9159_000918 [Coniocarpon cinnabarinum]